MKFEILIKIACFICVINLLTACDFQRLDTRSMKQELKGRALKRITPAQFSEAVMRFGDSLTKVQASSFFDSLSNKGTLMHQTPFSEKLKAKVICQALNKPLAQLEEGKTKTMLDAALYAVENKLPFKPTSQKADAQHYVYMAPAIRAQKDTVGVWIVEFPLPTLIEAMNIKGMK